MGTFNIHIRPVGSILVWRNFEIRELGELQTQVTLNSLPKESDVPSQLVSFRNLLQPNYNYIFFNLGTIYK